MASRKLKARLKASVDAMKRDAHAWGDCGRCFASVILLKNYETLAKKLAVDKLKSLLAFPAAHLGRAHELMGADLLGDVKDRPIELLLQKSIVLVMQCAKEHASDVLVQVICGFALYTATIEGDKFMTLLWSGGACDTILSAMDMIVKGKVPSNTLPLGFAPHLLLGVLLKGLCLMYGSPPEPRHVHGLPAVCSAMNIMTEFPESLTYAMFVLSSACENCPKNCALVGHAGIDSIISAMKRYPQDDKLQCNALATLSHVCSDEKNNNLQHLAKSDLLRMFVRITEINANSIFVQVSATQLYLVLGQCGGLEIRQLLVTAGCTRCIVQGMIRFKDIIIEAGISDLLSSGIMTLSKIVDPTLPRELKTRVVAEGAGEAVIYVMSVRKEPMSQQLGLTILSSLILHHPENTHALGFQVLSATLGVLRTMKQEHAYIQHMACPLLHQIMQACIPGFPHSESAAGRNEERAKYAELEQNARKYQDEFVRCEGVSLLMKILEMNLESRHMGAGDIRAAVGDGVFVRTDGLAAACATIPLVVFDHRENQDKFGAAAVNLLLHVLDMYTTDTLVQTHACAAIRALAKNNARITAACARIGSMEHILRCEDERLHFDDGHCDMETLNLSLKSRATVLSDGLRRAGNQQATCVACSKTAAMLGVEKLLKCSACTLAPSYCSVECQRACWKEHKSECKANTKQTCSQPRR
jgi:hypothetical protein